MNIEEQVRKNCVDLPFEQVAVVTWPALNLPQSGGVIMFVFARWSAQSASSFRLLTKELAATKQPPGLVVVDTDSIDTEGFQQKFGCLPQGKGESYWFKNGTLMRSDKGYAPVDVVALRKNLAAFLGGASPE